MTKSLKFFAMAVMLISMAFGIGSCTNDFEADEIMVPEPTSRVGLFVGQPTEEFGNYEGNLIAGQHIVVGTVKITNDYDNVYVTLTTTDDWMMGRTHLFVGPREVLFNPANKYVNKNGSPVPGQFPRGETLDPAQTTWTCVIPLDELYPMFLTEFPEEICPLVAAHAEVFKVDAEGNVIQAETAWGEGDKFVQKGNWGMYIDEYCVKFPPIVPPTPPVEYEFQTETAWAFNGFCNDLKYGGNWARFVEYKGETITFGVLAGQKETDMTVTLAPTDEGKVKVIIANVFEIAPENDGRWVFQDVPDAVKVQGYETAPVGTNPAPGLFTYYKGRDLTFEVEKANFYGIHLDVGKLTYK